MFFCSAILSLTVLADAASVADWVARMVSSPIAITASFFQSSGKDIEPAAIGQSPSGVNSFPYSSRFFEGLSDPCPLPRSRVPPPPLPGPNQASASRLSRALKLSRVTVN